MSKSSKQNSHECTLTDLKKSDSRWPDRNLAGNTIDFFVQVLGMSFHDAMRQITAM
jgi:hypothetical protein